MRRQWTWMIGLLAIVLIAGTFTMAFSRSRGDLQMFTPVRSHIVDEASRLGRENPNYHVYEATVQGLSTAEVMRRLKPHLLQQGFVLTGNDAYSFEFSRERSQSIYGSTYDRAANVTYLGFYRKTSWRDKLSEGVRSWFRGH